MRGSAPAAEVRRTAPVGPPPRLAVLPLLAMLLVLPGCQGAGPVHGASQDLDGWIQDTLLPGLQRTIGQSPRFRHQRFAVVRMAEGRLEGRIDGLSMRLREEITDALAALPQVRLPGIPGAADPFQRRRRDPDCAPPHHADYFIGILSEPVDTTRHRITVRIFDAHESQWVSGIRFTWQGRLTPSERAAARTVRADPFLKGIRQLPFGADEADLAAAHFANTLSCLLAREGLSEARVHLERPRKAPPAIATLAEILDNALARLRRVVLVRDPKRATHRLVLEWHALGQGLVQVWVSMETRGRVLAGVDTAAYLRLTPSRGSTGGPKAPVAQARTPTRAPASRPRVHALEVLHAPLHAHCDAPTDRAGKRLAPSETVIPGACLGVHAEADGRLVLIQLTPQGRLLRLDPARCRVPGAAGVALFAAWRGGIGAVYALALDDQTPAALRRHLEAVPAPCGNATRPTWPPAQAQRWARRLDRLLAESADHVHWAVRRIRYAPQEG